MLNFQYTLNFLFLLCWCSRYLKPGTTVAMVGRNAQDSHTDIHLAGSDLLKLLLLECAGDRDSSFEAVENSWKSDASILQH